MSVPGIPRNNIRKSFASALKNKIRNTARDISASKIKSPRGAAEELAEFRSERRCSLKYSFAMNSLIDQTVLSTLLLASCNRRHRDRWFCLIWHLKLCRGILCPSRPRSLENVSVQTAGTKRIVGSAVNDFCFFYAPSRCHQMDRLFILPDRTRGVEEIINFGSVSLCQDPMALKIVLLLDERCNVQSDSCISRSHLQVLPRVSTSQISQYQSVDVDRCIKHGFSLTSARHVIRVF